MKKTINKDILFGIVIGIILCGGVICGTNVYESYEVEYSSTDASWEVSNVGDALNSLYSVKNELDNTKTALNNLKSLGDATTSDIVKGKTAIVQGKLVTGSLNSNDIKKTLVWTGTIDPTHTSATTNEYIYLNNSYSDYKNITASNIGVEQTDIAVVATAFGGCSTSWNYTPSSGLITLTVTGRKGFPNCGKQSYNVYVYTAS